jgi:hypothetical protein
VILRQSVFCLLSDSVLGALGTGAFFAVVFVLVLPVHQQHSAPTMPPSPYVRDEDGHVQTGAERDAATEPECTEDLGWSIHLVDKHWDESGAAVLSATAEGSRQQSVRAKGARPASPSPRSRTGSTRRRKSNSPPGTPSSWQTTRFSWIDTDQNEGGGAGQAAPESEAAQAAQRRQEHVWQIVLGDRWGRLSACGCLGVAATLCKETGAAVFLHAILQEGLDVCVATSQMACLRAVDARSVVGEGGESRRAKAGEGGPETERLAAGAIRGCARMCGGALLLAAILAGRKALTGERFGPEFSLLDNPFYYLQTRTQRLLSILVVHGEYARVLLWPTHLSADYSFNCIPAARGLILCPPCAFSLAHLCAACARATV